MPDVVTLTDATFDSHVSAGETPWLVDFWAQWCAPCLALEPILHEIAAELDGRLHVGRLDTLANPSTTRRFAVSSVPTLLVFSGGTMTKRLFATRTRLLLAELSDVTGA